MNKNANIYATQLVRSNGLPTALKIAKRCAEGSSPRVETELPNSSKSLFNIFFPNGKKGEAQRAIKQRRRNHGFWTQVFHILNKGAK